MKRVPMNLYVLCLKPFGSKTKLVPKISFFEKKVPNIYCQQALDKLIFFKGKEQFTIRSLVPAAKYSKFSIFQAFGL